VKYYIIRKLDKHDHDLLFIEDTERDRCIGFIGKKERNGKRTIGLERCPVCGHENWAMAVTSGICAWCNWEIDRNAVLKLEESDAKG